MARAGVRSEATRLSLQRAALAVAMEYGVKGVTHRRVAAAAGVALGSASYHYENIDELMFEAFATWVRSNTGHYVPQFEAARTDEDIVAAVKNVLAVIHGSEDARILLFEIYAQSVRDPAYFAIVSEWSRETRASMLHLYTPETVQKIEAVWEGIGVQLVMGVIDSIEEVESLLRLVLAAEPAGSKVKRQHVAAREARNLQKSK
jgi:DNA-binding transcriptional regulator YbjK